MASGGTRSICAISKDKQKSLDPRGRLAAIRLIALSKEEMEPALAGLSSKNWRQFCPMLFENGPSFGMDIRQDPR